MQPGHLYFSTPLNKISLSEVCEAGEGESAPHSCWCIATGGLYDCHLEKLLVDIKFSSQTAGVYRVKSRGRQLHIFVDCSGLQVILQPQPEAMMDILRDCYPRIERKVPEVRTLYNCVVLAAALPVAFPRRNWMSTGGLVRSAKTTSRTRTCFSTRGELRYRDGHCPLGHNWMKSLRLHATVVCRATEALQHEGLRLYVEKAYSVGGGCVAEVLLSKSCMSAVL